MKRRLTPEQIVRKLRGADRLLAEARKSRKLPRSWRFRRSARPAGAVEHLQRVFGVSH